MNNGWSRRNWLKAAGLGIGSFLGSNLLGGCASQSSNRTERIASKARAGSVRVAHISDIHIQPELDAARGFASSLRHVQSQKPELIFNTGDCVMDTLHVGQDRTRVQWDLWRDVTRAESSLPIHSCLGNHDIWGWGRERSGTTGNEPGWGKRWALDALGLSKPYHAFDHGAWRFIMLDSCQMFPAATWEARLDEEQFAWLESELKATTRPVMVGSHIPILSPAVFLDFGRIGGTAEAPALSGRRIHLDVKRIGQLFSKHPNVKLCVSGHLHQIDKAKYRGVTYMCNPAISGNWWKGHVMETFSESYTLYDLHPDGTFDYQYVDYGWNAVAPATQPTTQRA